jgi:hypothetical protein
LEDVVVDGSISIWEKSQLDKRITGDLFEKRAFVDKTIITRSIELLYKNIRCYLS